RILIWWGLIGQSEWSEHFPDCGGTSQSPVDVITTQTKYEPSLIPVTPLGYSQHGNQPFTLWKNKSAVLAFFFFFSLVIVELPEWMGFRGLPWFFTAAQLHLHWGNGGPGNGGSEHTINGRSADAELHVVHYNSELYTNMSAAMTQKDGLAVFGILIEVTQQDTTATQSGEQPLEDFKQSKYAGMAFIPAFDVQSLFPEDLGRYYRYNGSLTTPPCYQSVIWTVFHERVQISKAQVSLKTHEKNQTCLISMFMTLKHSDC
uniref:Carbonic anhydrase XIV n=1 Tax=Nothobranchius furzeri TaxID=105023 RepID=A0A8C6PLV6_NOTFU